VRDAAAVETPKVPTDRLDLERGSPNETLTEHANCGEEQGVVQAVTGLAQACQADVGVHL
jgi:hypothetical protein